MRIGFTGPHRAGKTTLATLLAAERGAKTVLSTTSEIVAKHGFDMATDNRVAHSVGLKMQQEIQEVLIERIKAAGSSFVSDRCPTDVAAYLIADATAERGDEFDWEDALQQMDQAIKATNEMFDVVIYVPAAIAFEPAPGKPPMNSLYQEHHGLVCRGLHADLSIPAGSIHRENTSIAGRMEAIRQYLYGIERQGTLLRAA